MNTKTHLMRGGGGLRREYAILLLIFVLVGLWLRLRHLGDLSLMVDEGIEALAVRGILEHGTPELESGLTYVRWPLYLYMQAGLAYLFELDPFWLRLPSVVWGVAAIVPAYVLGKMLFNRPVGLLTAAILAFSVWGIELARYARGYTAFQFFFLISLLCFYRGFMLDENRYKVGFLVAAGFTFLTHALSEFLIALFLIPLFSSAFTWSRKLTFGLWGLGIGGMIALRRKFAGLQLPEEGTLAFPEEGGAAAGLLDQIRQAIGLPPLNLPDMSFFFQAVEQNPLFVAALALVAGSATIYLCYRLARKGMGAGRAWQVVLGLLMVWAAFAYQFGLVALALIVYLAAFARDLRVLRAPILRAALGAAAVCFVAWFVLLAGSPRLPVRQVPFTLFGFPDVHGFFLTWLVNGWPVMTVGLAIGSVLLFVRFIKDRSDPVPIFLLGALYILAVLGSLFESYQESRYIFHLYPLIVIIFSMVVFEGGAYVVDRLAVEDLRWRRGVLLVGLPVMLFVSQDAHPGRAWAVGERTYQSERDPIRSVISWWPYAGFHQDIEGPSRFVKERLAEEDKVVAIGIGYMISLYEFYVGDVDYYVTPKDDPYVSTLVGEGQPIHYVTGSRVVSGPAGLKQLIQEHDGRLWLLGDRRIFRTDNSYYSDEMGTFLDALTRETDYVGRDGITFAVKIRNVIAESSRQTGAPDRRSVQAD